MVEILVVTLTLVLVLTERKDSLDYKENNISI